MSRSYSKISTRLWRSKKFKALKNNDRAKLLYFYIHTCPHVNSVGCFPLPLGYAVTDLGWGDLQVTKAIDDLAEVNLIEWCENDDVVRIVNFIHFDPPTNSKHAAAMMKDATALADCPAKLSVLRELAEQPHIMSPDSLSREIERLSTVFLSLPPLPVPVPLPVSLPEPEPRPVPEPVSAQPQDAADTPAAKTTPSKAVVVHEQPFIRLPTNRFATKGEEVGVTQAEVDDYAATYPAVDVPQEFREMRKWLEQNVAKRKTASGMGKFVNGWLAREQDRGGHRLSLNGSGGHGAARTESSVSAARSLLEERHGPGKSH